MQFREYIDRKPWKAHRADIIQFWQNLRANIPIRPRPVDKFHKGTRFRQDGLRITGSPDFINGVLSRLKDILQYDNYPGTKLDVEYRAIENREGELIGIPTYVCYVHIIQKKSED